MSGAPRYGRITALGGSVAVTLVALLGSVGVLPTGAAGPADATAPGAITVAVDTGPVREQMSGRVNDPVLGPPMPTTTDPAPSGDDAAPSALDDPLLDSVDVDTLLPRHSGEGRRAVFSESRQRVWLVGEAGDVERTYPVSGSIYDNLDPGTFEVYSRSEQAWGIDDSGTMQWFVRFTQGDNGAAIGFHDIPVDDGEQLQSVAELGTPTSHGCIRQREADAKAMWAFAPIGTTVVVTA